MLCKSRAVRIYIVTNPNSRTYSDSYQLNFYILYRFFARMQSRIYRKAARNQAFLLVASRQLRQLCFHMEANLAWKVVVLNPTTSRIFSRLSSDGHSSRTAGIWSQCICVMNEIILSLSLSSCCCNARAT